MARRGGVPVGDGEERDPSRNGAVGDEPFRTRDDIGVAVANGARADTCNVGAGVGLGQGECGEMLAGREIRQPARLLLVAAKADDRQRPELVRREDQSRGRAGPTELLDSEADRQQLPTEPAVLGRERQCQDVLTGQQLTEVLGDLSGAVVVRGTRCDSLIGKRADGIAKEGLLLGQSIAGRCGLGHRGHRSSEVRCGRGQPGSRAVSSWTRIAATRRTSSNGIGPPAGKRIVALPAMYGAISSPSWSITTALAGNRL